jgi:hypothetical protein
MATYQIHINEKTLRGRDMVTGKDFLHKGIEGGLKDVRQILDGKQPKKTLKDILHEL